MCLRHPAIYPPHGLPQFGEEMVLDAVVSPTSQPRSNHSPLIAQLVVKPKEQFFFVLAPTIANSERVEVIVVSI